MQRYSIDDVALAGTQAVAELGTRPLPGPAIPFEFTGTTGDYFRIWAPNLLLSIVTLGLYSPWAKVRRLRYFYGCTSVNCASFTYHASPIAILKGRLLTYGVLAAAFAVSYFSPGMGQVFYVLLAVFWPAIIVKALRFRNRNSGYRGVRFNFDGNFGDAYRVYYWLGLLMVPTIGLIYPHLVAEQQKFVVNATRYGTSPFRLDLSSTLFFQIFVRAVSLFIALAVVAVGVYFVVEYAVAGVGFDMVPIPGSEDPAAGAAIMSIVAVLLIFSCFGIVYLYFQTAVKNLVWNNLSLVEQDVVMDEVFRGTPLVQQLACFTSTLKASRVIWISMTNWAAIMATAGLAVPWARIRLARYRAECLHLHRSAALERVVAGQAQAEAATGSEFAEAVDFDIGL